MSRPTRVLLVDDSVVVRGMLGRLIDAEPDLEVASTAADGRIAVQKLAKCDPDVVILDVEMPVMGGLEALVEIRRTHPTLPVIMFSTLTEQGAATTLDALAAGASDYAHKPTAEGSTTTAFDQVRAELLTKIRALRGAQRVGSVSTARPSPATSPRKRISRRASVDAVVMGSSTGGPVALERVLSDIDQPLDVPMFVVQHMPQNFTTALADRLDRRTCHRVVEADADMVVQAGTVYVAPGGKHLRLVRRSTSVVLDVSDGPLVNSCRPSVDPLFESAADIYGAHTLALMLTGMGSDGTNGTRKLADVGADVIAQDENTSIVWGMPRSVIEAGLTTDVLPIGEIGSRVASLVSARSLRERVARSAVPT